MSTLPADDTRLQDFWLDARKRARIGGLEVFVGTPWGDVVVPPAWGFGDSPALAHQLLDLVLAGAKTATTGLLQQYQDEGEPIPQVGDLSILLDGSDIPRALIRDVEVVCARFGDITAEQAAAEGEGDRALATWRADHRRYFERAGYLIDDDSLVIWERFEVLYQT